MSLQVRDVFISVLPTSHSGQSLQDLVPGFRASMEAFYDAAMAMSRRILRLLALTLDLPPAWFLDRFKRPLTTLRLLHYSAQPSDPDEVRDPGLNVLPLQSAEVEAYSEPRSGQLRRKSLRPGAAVAQMYLSPLGAKGHAVQISVPQPGMPLSLTQDQTFRATGQALC